MITRDQVETIVKKNVPSSAHVVVSEVNRPLGNGTWIRIAIAASNHNINNVQGQNPQKVQLCLSPNTNELQTLNFGGMGDRRIYLIPEEGVNLVHQSIRLPFRTPKPVDKSVIKAIENFSKRWTQTLKDNKDRLSYSTIVDYDSLLSS